MGWHAGTIEQIYVDSDPQDVRVLLNDTIAGEPHWFNIDASDTMRFGAILQIATATWIRGNEFVACYADDNTGLLVAILSHYHAP